MTLDANFLRDWVRGILERHDQAITDPTEETA